MAEELGCSQEWGISPAPSPFPGAGLLCMGLPLALALR